MSYDPKPISPKEAAKLVDTKEHPEYYKEKEPVKKGDEMDEEVDKAKGPERFPPKKPGKMPLSANKQAITEEPATRSSTHQNYKSTPDMHKSNRYQGRKSGKESEADESEDLGDEEGTWDEPITKSDEVALKKAIASATELFKSMTEELEKAYTRPGRASTYFQSSGPATLETHRDAAKRYSQAPGHSVVKREAMQELRRRKNK
jgi:hypothetical protein